MRAAINQFVNALPVGQLARRLTSAESAVSRLEREVRRVVDLVGKAAQGGAASAPSRGTAAKRATARDGRRAAAAGTRAGAGRTAGARGGASGAATRGRAARGGATRGSAARGHAVRGAAPRAGAARGGRRVRASAAAKPGSTRVPVSGAEERAVLFTPAEPSPESWTSRPLDDEAASASQDMMASSSPMGPGPLPAP